MTSPGLTAWAVIFLGAALPGGVAGDDGLNMVSFTLAPATVSDYLPCLGGKASCVGIDKQVLLVATMAGNVDVAPGDETSQGGTSCKINDYDVTRSMVVAHENAAGDDVTTATFSYTVAEGDTDRGALDPRARTRRRAGARRRASGGA